MESRSYLEPLDDGAMCGLYEDELGRRRDSAISAFHDTGSGMMTWSVWRVDAGKCALRSYCSTRVAGHHHMLENASPFGFGHGVLGRRIFFKQEVV